MQRSARQLVDDHSAVRLIDLGGHTVFITKTHTHTCDYNLITKMTYRAQDHPVYA